MVIQIQDFEDETTGEIPSNWEGFIEVDITSDLRRTFVTEDEAIIGNKSFKIEDYDSGAVGARRSLTDEDYSFGAAFERVFDGGKAQTVWIDTKAGYFYSIWSPTDRGDGSTFDVYFGEGSVDDLGALDRDKEDMEAVATKVAEVPPVTGGSADFDFVDVTTDLKFFIDGALIHQPGAGYTGASVLEIIVDDVKIIIDQPGVVSDYVFHKGDPVNLGNAENTFVFESGYFVQDKGESNFAFIDGRGINYSEGGS